MSTLVRLLGVLIYKERFVVKKLLLTGAVICALMTSSSAGEIENFRAASGSTFQVDGKTVGVANANQPWSLVKIDDYTLEMACHQGDHWGVPAFSDPPNANRSELNFEVPYFPAGQQITVTEKITVMPGPVSTAGWMNMNQLHSTSDNPPSPFYLSLEKNTDKLQVILQSPTNNWNQVYKSSAPVVRGKEFEFKVVMTMGPSGNGKVDVWIDGAQVVNYRGAVGANNSDYYWKWGCYRENVPEVVTIRHKNMHLVTE
jgi:hypothetical protein